MSKMSAAMMETETIETFSEERTIAVQKQEIELHDSASILVKLSLRTMKGMVSNYLLFYSYPLYCTYLNIFLS